MKKAVRYGLLTLVLLATLGAATFFFAPWKPYLAARISHALTAQGLPESRFTIGDLTPRGVTLSDVSVGTEVPLALTRATIGYSLQGIRNKTVEDITLSGLKLTASKGAEGWQVAELAAFNKPTAEKKTFTIPVTRAALAALPVTRVAVSDSSLTLASDGLSGDIPLALSFTRAGTPSLTYDAPSLTLTAGKTTLTTGAIKITATLDETAAAWKGNWSLDTLNVSGAPVMLPPLSAKGDFTLTADAAQLNGTLTSDDKSYHAAFALAYPLAVPDTAKLTLTAARVPWNGGVLSVKNVALPLTEKRAVSLTLNVDHVSLATLMQSLTGDKASGTGAVSGSIPVRISANGEVTFGEANLKAEEPGVIALAPEVIPGDNPQVVLVRDILKNLHYSLLSMRLENRPNKKLALLLSVEGNNPDMPNARNVRLNVQLNGDLLQLVQQSIMTLTDPKQLLENEANEPN